MLTNKISKNLNEALRFSGNPIESQETVAQHIASMNLLAIELYNSILHSIKDVNFDIGQLCYRITIHDLDEAAMGDIPRPIKYHDDNIYKELTRVSVEEMRRNYHEKICSDSENSKDETLYGWITNLLDVLQCVMRLKISVGYNRRYLGHLRNSVEVLQDRLAKFIYFSFATKEESEIQLVVAREMQEEILYAFET